MASGNSIVVKYLTHHPKDEGSVPAAAAGKRQEMMLKENFFNQLFAWHQWKSMF
jgi:hypothetical protein